MFLFGAVTILILHISSSKIRDSPRSSDEINKHCFNIDEQRDFLFKPGSRTLFQNQ